MGSRVKKIIAFALATAVFGSVMTGCSGVATKSGMGRYVEERYEKNSDLEINKVTKLQDGTLGAVVYNYEGGSGTAISEDGGKTWVEQPINVPEVEGKEVWINNVGFIANGNRLVCYSINEITPEFEDGIVPDDYEWVEPELLFGVADENGDIEEVELNLTEYYSEDNMWGMSDFKTSKDGDVFFKAGEEMDMVIQLDGETFEEKNVFEGPTWFDNYIIVGNSLVITEYSEILEFDLETGKLKGNLSELEKETVQKENGYYNQFIDTGSEEKLYYYSTLGLYCYDMNSKKSELMIDGAISSFGDDEMSVNSLVELGDDELLGIFSEWSDNYENVVINFKYNPDIPSVPENELVVYTLIENDTLRQAVSKYSKANPDTYVRFEIGLDYGSGMTKADALKTLNTEIMAGNGPDIIVLDGLSAESYIEKGLLEDISDIVNPLVDAGTIFKNIAEAQSVDGKIYHMPLNIKFPVLLGNKDDINSITDIESLIEVAKKYVDIEGKKIFSNYFYDIELFYGLYPLFGQEWLNSDNTIDEEALAEYFEKIKSASELVKENTSKYDEYISNMYSQLDFGDEFVDDGFSVMPEIDEEYIEDEEYDNSEWEEEYENNKDLYEISDLKYYLVPYLPVDGFLLNEDAHLGFGAISSTDTYAEVITTILNNSDLDYKVFSRGDENIYVGENIIGLNAKASNKEEAKKLIESLLTGKGSSRGWNEGLSVNKNNVIDSFKVEETEGYEREKDEKTGRYVMYGWGTTLPDGTEKMVNILYPNDEDVNKLISEIESLNTPATINTVLLTEAVTQFRAYIEGEKSLEEAINTVVDNLDLYLSE